MQNSFVSMAVALTLVGGASLASAAQLNLSAAQKQAIYQSAMSEKGQAAPVGFQPKVGATAPQSLTLHALPSSVVSKISAAKNYEYAKLQNNEILLVNPKDRQVAEILTEPSTTGQRK